MNKTVSPPSPESSQELPSPEPSGPLHGRLLQLDVLRGIAVLLVVSYHFGGLPGTRSIMIPSAAGFISPLAMLLWRIGWSGVDLFFVLSGFLVGGLLFRELVQDSRLRIGRFIIRRGFKIWPSYFVYLSFLLVVLTLNLGSGKAVDLLLPNFLHIQNYWRTPRGHTWSLAVEEHFYLALPLLILALTARRTSRGNAVPFFPVIAILTLATCLLIRVLTPLSARGYSAIQWTHTMPTHTRIDSLVIGVLLAYIYHFHPEAFQSARKHRVLLFAAGLALLAPFTLLVIQESRFIVTIGFSLVYLGFACLLVAMLHTLPSDGTFGRLVYGIPGRVFAFVGVYSYPIYLWHIDFAIGPMYNLARRHFLSGLPTSIRYVALMVLSLSIAVAVGVVMGRLVESPALKLRNRMFPSSIRPVTQPPITERNDSID